MTWECSECGECVTRSRPPTVCRDCGTAAIFVRADEEELSREVDHLRATWLQAGMEQRRYANC
jgi:hypothetical protein